jgi:8-oxo-dGTP diphosphatase
MDLSKDKVDATLVFLLREQKKQMKVLLAKKVRKIVVGRYNGFGGSMRQHETPRACAVRELRKESGYIVFKKDLEFRGIVTFRNQMEGREDFVVQVFIFTSTKWRGTLKLKEDEMIDPKWFKTYRLPLKKMAAGDKKFVPQLLNNIHPDKIVRGEIWYGHNQKSLLGWDVKWVAKTGDVD